MQTFVHPFLGFLSSAPNFFPGTKKLVCTTSKMFGFRSGIITLGWCCWWNMTDVIVEVLLPLDCIKDIGKLLCGCFSCWNNGLHWVLCDIISIIHCCIVQQITYSNGTRSCNTMCCICHDSLAIIFFSKGKQNAQCRKEDSFLLILR